MAGSSSIEWTEKTWNPLAGSTKVSKGCTNCYALKMAHRQQAMGRVKYLDTTRRSGARIVWTGKINLDPATLDIPYSWTKGCLIFVNSMSDLFQEDVPLDYIQQVFAVMRDTPHHTYQVLTKRAERLEELSPLIDWPRNVWMGVSVENERAAMRIDHLRSCGAHVRFLSCEPLLGALKSLNLSGIDWVIAGGESGPGARQMKPKWVRSIRDQCIEQGVAFHFKQWGGVVKSKHGRALDGRNWDDMPPR
ncbi:MAG: phage Gp37/Gp68 family protein [Sphingomonadaceae bacterium]|nr:phage Gp37/Gp68 family protein [Sphingomonadaceae bacterium]